MNWGAEESWGSIILVFPESLEGWIQPYTCALPPWLVATVSVKFKVKSYVQWEGDLKVQIQVWFGASFLLFPHFQLLWRSLLGGFIPFLLGRGGTPSLQRWWTVGIIPGEMWGSAPGIVPKWEVQVPLPSLPSRDEEITTLLSGMGPSPLAQLRFCLRKGPGSWWERRKKKWGKVNNPQGIHSTQMDGLYYKEMKNPFTWCQHSRNFSSISEFWGEKK